MSEKPSYLGLLNAIANAEGDAHKYLNAWADATDDPDVENIIRTVAIREGEHSLAFEKRLCELGYSVIRKTDPTFNDKMKMLASRDVSDLEKFECLGYREGGKREDPFGEFFSDTSMDINTMALMGRYVGEERDSGRMLEACFNELCRREGRSGTRVAGNGHDAGVSLDDICAEIQDLKACVADLQEAVSAMVGASTKKSGKKAAARH